MQNHGDRVAAGKPLSEILVEPSDPEYGEQGDDTMGLSASDHQWMQSTDAPLVPPDRLSCAQIAAISFGATGVFDNDLLLQRAEAIYNYAMNGPQ